MCIILSEDMIGQIPVHQYLWHWAEFIPKYDLLKKNYPLTYEIAGLHIYWKRMISFDWQCAYWPGVNSLKFSKLHK